MVWSVVVAKLPSIGFTYTTDQLFWAGHSCLFYLPGTVAPIGAAADGLPVGVQIVGPQYGDRTCIEMARLLEREFARFVPPPGYA